MEDLMYVRVRAVCQTFIMKCSLDEFDTLQKKHKSIEKSLMQFQHKMLKSNKKYPLDVEQVLPDCAFSNNVGHPILVRPSYVLSGSAMNIICSEGARSSKL